MTIEKEDRFIPYSERLKALHEKLDREGEKMTQDERIDLRQNIAYYERLLRIQ